MDTQSTDLVSTGEIKHELNSWARASLLSRPWRIILSCVVLGFVASAVLLWSTASNATLARIQTFNGAMTIPVGGLTWAFAFTFVFLVPMKAMQILMAKVMLYQIQVSEKVEEKIEKRFLDRIDKLMNRLEQNPDEIPAFGRLHQFVLDLTAEGRRIRESIDRAQGSLTRRIEPAPMPGDPVNVGQDPGNGKTAQPTH
jgi:hypothetical protein